jgi:hypothetical protein
VNKTFTITRRQNGGGQTKEASTSRDEEKEAQAQAAEQFRRKYKSNYQLVAQFKMHLAMELAADAYEKKDFHENPIWQKVLSMKARNSPTWREIKPYRLIIEMNEEELQIQKRKREVEEEVNRKREEAEQLKRKQIAAEELKRKQELDRDPKRKQEIEKRQRYVDWCDWQKDPLRFAYNQSLLPPEKRSPFQIPAEGDRWQYDAELNDIKLVHVRSFKDPKDQPKVLQQHPIDKESINMKPTIPVPTTSPLIPKQEIKTNPFSPKAIEKTPIEQKLNADQKKKIKDFVSWQTDPELFDHIQRSLPPDVRLKFKVPVGKEKYKYDTVTKEIVLLKEEPISDPNDPPRYLTV